MFELIAKRQWNELANLLAASKLEPTSFERTSWDAGWAGFTDSFTPAICYKFGEYERSDYVFAIAEYVDPRISMRDQRHTLSVGMRPGTEQQFEHYEDLSWEDVTALFRKWLANLEEEVTTPDLWDNLEALRRSPGLTESDTSDNAPFSNEAQHNLQSGLDELLVYVRVTYSLTPGQDSALAGEIEYLKQAVDRLGRRDWLGIVTGSIIGWALGTAVPGETARDVWGKAVTVIRRVIDSSQRPKLPK